MGKGEIARYEQFLLFPQCFLKTLQKTRKNQGLFGKGLILAGSKFCRLVKSEIKSEIDLLSANASIWTSSKFWSLQ